MSHRDLYMGLDLRDSFSQLAVMAPQDEEPKMISNPQDKTGQIQIPTEVVIPGTRETIGGFLVKILEQEPIIAAGVESDPVNVLAAFLQKILSFTRRDFPEGTIRRLVVTTPYRDFVFNNTI